MPYLAFFRGNREAQKLWVLISALDCCQGFAIWIQGCFAAELTKTGKRRQQLGRTDSPCFFFACSHTDLRYAIRRVLNRRLFPIVEGKRWGWGRKNWSGKVWPRAKEAFLQQEIGLFSTEALEIVFLVRWTYNMFQRNTVARSKDWADYSSISQFCQHAK